jgi:hypothetical protein
LFSLGYVPALGYIPRTELNLVLSVALIVLFGDSLNIVFPDISSNTWKLIGFIV